IGGAIGAFVIDKTLTYTYTTGFMNSLFSGTFAK
ncbi:colicin V synthesis protein, partial [Xylella fastidiosa subsp. fastidiosa]